MRNIKIAFRNLKKQKIVSVINLFGLATGITCFVLIALYVFDEFTYDRFHKNADNIFRVIETNTQEGKTTRTAAVAGGISENIKKHFPEIEDAVRFTTLGRANIANTENDKVFYDSYHIGNGSFLKMFDFPTVAGNSVSALNAPYSVVLTEEMAVKIFGHKDVVGKTILNDRDSTPYSVTAVIQVPANSHIKFNLIFSESSLASNEFFKNIHQDWNSNNFTTYVLLNNNSANKVETGLNRMVTANRATPQGLSHFELQPLKNIHFYSAGIEGTTEEAGNITQIKILGFVALFVLLIACINYTNLTTARFAARSKEIAVRKVAGASRANLVRQFLTEGFLMTALATAVSILLVNLSLSSFNTFTEKKLSLGLQTDYRIWVGIVLTLIVTALIAGVYPALFQSKLKPNLLLKKAGQTSDNYSIRKVLVVFQFTLSIIMIIAAIVVYQQVKYLDTADMGFSKEEVMVVDINSGKVRRNAKNIISEFSMLPGVKDVSVSSRVPGEWKDIPKVKISIAEKQSTSDEAYLIAADQKFIHTFKIALKDGVNFSGNDISDSTSILLNETAAKMLGVTQPASQLIQIPSVSREGNYSALNQPFTARVVGIVKDFNFQSMHEKVAPLILAYAKNPIHQIDYFSLKIGTQNIESTIKELKAVMYKIDPTHLFEYNFLDKKWDHFYREHKKRQSIFLGIAGLTILISSLGLFGLTAYAAQQRSKEIGIRKVLGATIFSIVGMLSNDFIKLIFIAAFLAFPIAWLWMNNWLQDFAYHINISWWIFLAAAAVSLAIALLTVSIHAYKAARSNPIKSLRTE